MAKSSEGTGFLVALGKPVYTFEKKWEELFIHQAAIFSLLPAFDFKFFCGPIFL
jgi:hypothetical protein